MSVAHVKGGSPVRRRGAGGVAAPRQIADELRHQNERFSAAVENMSHGLCMFDADERMIICNGNYISIFSLDAKIVRPGIAFLDILKHSVDIGVASQSAEDLYAIRKPYIERAQASTYEEILSDGRIVSITHRPLASGGWVSIYEDITEQRRAEQELKEQHRRFDAALANMSQGLLMYDAEGTLIVRNQRFLDLYKVTPDDFPLGMSQRALLEQMVRLRIYPSMDIDGEIANTRASLQAGEERSTDRSLADGRTLLVARRPLTGGGWVATFEDITERRRAEERMSHLAHYDTLTDLPNRSMFRERLDQAMTGDTPLAIFSLDLDRFKAVNDTWGHPAGDWLLKCVAERLRHSLRSDTDVVARLGGDEFAILQFNPKGATDAEQLAKRIVAVVSQPFRDKGRDMHVGISLGIALYPGDGKDADTLLKNADMALYSGKSEGRNVYRFFEPGMDALVRARLALETDLETALKRREFVLEFQPITNIASGKIVGAEALMRWNSPTRGLVAPDDFIAAAEDSGLIVPLGEWALKQACSVAAGWPPGMRIAVNVSAVQIRSADFARSVISALAVSGVPASRLELEITETVLMDESETVLKTLRQLRELGIRIALDDFGTGYSSLGYLRRFPVDKIKIDRSFIHDIDNKDTAAIVRTIIGLGAELGITVTAEGVETEAQLDILRKAGCVEAQGFLIGMPSKAADMARLLKTRAASRRA
ncbi:diguanylate phosphodiesterase [Mesorhizobium sp. LSJC268A00]|uniref:putative bifunctional diguanylate cyclase/phosphodiesterase n=1 Tax=unclassified Mesorhizobium TaxID=325217 RepID=UPI0003CDDC57|nr:MULTISPECIES: EAL domain-containing protein [unclassified Mesorhizobium]ESX03875.1 diguanylate phosphodiesterase [Mesorhizobium sp. LSJC268A00]ESX87607.1 diguanylate phosphodiesterase [Mesorhizobium sp. LNJC405B00]ESY29650.1 diguanylate phosphodiesterase [Mesorhizobium sp. LNJC391B00]ESZ10443.1 diguanylate phosphodiesterase [Mesorhizobium sp. L2C085B000]ESZ36565.1 diguanylate phosphodiesterase [Mesorhizobium sp. L2C054A000]